METALNRNLLHIEAKKKKNKIKEKKRKEN